MVKLQTSEMSLSKSSEQGEIASCQRLDESWKSVCREIRSCETT